MKKIPLIVCMLLGCFFLVGGGTASAARKPMEKEKAVNNLYDCFLFDKKELGSYLDKGISYLELKNICLHAYAAEKPLREVAALREKYGWGRVKFLLGLTPEKLARRELDYKAGRLQRLFGLEKKETMKYMRLGYGSHPVKRAMFIASHSGKSVEEILALKTRQIKWPEICVQLGLPADACMHKAGADAGNARAGNENEK